MTTYTILELNKPTKNNRTYSAEVIERALKNVGGLACYGTLGQTSDQTMIDLEKISHHVTNLRVVDDMLLGDVSVLKTPMGLALQAALDAGANVSFHPIGVGNVNDEGVITDYSLASVSVVITLE